MADGRIFQINVSGGGVPKLAVSAAEVTVEGLTGDWQQDRKHHGGPERAVCLFSLERILALQEEGHPVFPGAAGENLTLVGLDWDEVVPGVRLRVGADVVLEVASYTSPCGTIKAFFLDEKSTRISQERHPGWSRVYARVIEPGRIEVGSAIAII